MTKQELYEAIYAYQAELERQVLGYVGDESLDKRRTNLAIKPLVSIKQILDNTIDSIEMVEKLSKEESDE